MDIGPVFFAKKKINKGGGDFPALYGKQVVKQGG